MDTVAFWRLGRWRDYRVQFPGTYRIFKSLAFVTFAYLSDPQYVRLSTKYYKHLKYNTT